MPECRCFRGRIHLAARNPSISTSGWCVNFFDLMIHLFFALVQASLQTLIFIFCLQGVLRLSSFLTKFSQRFDYDLLCVRLVLTVICVQFDIIIQKDPSMTTNLIHFLTVSFEYSLYYFSLYNSNYPNFSTPYT